ncbi:MAG TPA: hypothetical protein VGG74_21120 [Kofleriaceae bacterium]
MTDRIGDAASLNYPLWIRFPNSRDWHLVTEVGASWVTVCGGRIENSPDVDVDPSANPLRRCPVCQRARIMMSVERGLRELREIGCAAPKQITFEMLEDVE